MYYNTKPIKLWLRKQSATWFVTTYKQEWSIMQSQFSIPLSISNVHKTNIIIIEYWIINFLNTKQYPVSIDYWLLNKEKLCLHRLAGVILKIMSAQNEHLLKIISALYRCEAIQNSFHISRSDSFGNKETNQPCKGFYLYFKLLQTIVFYYLLFILVFFE